ncbi:hypothetical protein EAF00_009490 [Botryotinia globosa]|nr:hypothetical protein EAF00_009490 [Botryotinia globosa]
MFDLLSAFSLAATVVQFVDYLGMAQRSSPMLLSCITLPREPWPTIWSSQRSSQISVLLAKDELALIGLASQCKELSDKLLHDLDRLNIKEAHTQWSSACQAMRSLWKEA